MKELYKILEELEAIPNNKERKKYLYSILRNPNLGRHELKRIACNILIEDNFVDKYYRETFTEYVKNTALKLLRIFRRLLEKKRFLSQ